MVCILLVPLQVSNLNPCHYTFSHFRVACHFETVQLMTIMKRYEVKGTTCMLYHNQ